MQFEKLFQLLARDDVKELALQTDRPPCVLVGDGYTPILNRNFSEDEVIRALVEANGRTEVVALVSGARRWQFDHPTIGSIRVTAGYHGPLLQARLKLMEPRVADSRPTSAEKPSAQRGESLETSNARHVDTKLPASEPDEAFVIERPGAADTAVSSNTSVARNAAPVSAPAQPAQSRATQPQARASQPTSPQNVVAPAVTAPAPRAPSVPETFDSLGGSPKDVFESLLRQSRTKKASDLHILADRSPMLRVGGDMVKVGPVLAPALVEQMLMAVVPKHLHAELERDGSCDFSLQHATLGRFRTNVSRQRTGMKLTARPVSDHVASLAELGLPESIATATHHHQGLIIVTGPTGHGKTTTLAAIVDVVNRDRTDHIITVEDPIEFVHPQKRAVMSQREVGTHTRTFAAALKGSLREDPDVIAVGELRDTETVRMALSASETGHLVISTMNTPSAAKAIERLIDLFPPGDQPQVRMSLAGGLRMIISQRLVPSADRKTVKAAVELLPGSSALWALIRDNKTFQIPSLQQRGKSLGIVRLDDSLAELVRTGHTSLEIAREFAEAPEQLEALVRGTPVKPLDGPPPANENRDPNAAAQGVGANAQKFGKDMFSKAGKLFGGDK